MCSVQVERCGGRNRPSPDSVHNSIHGDRLFPRRFALVRHVDYTGVSGVGVVAYGVVFHDGHVALRWCSDHPATSLWASVEDLLAIHGHGDATNVQWIDDTTDRLHDIQASLNPPQGRRARRGPAPPAPPEPTVPETREPAPPQPRVADPMPPGPTEPPHQPSAARQAPEPANGTPDLDNSAVPPQRRSGGRHRRRAEPSEESAGQR